MSHFLFFNLLLTREAVLSKIKIEISLGGVFVVYDKVIEIIANQFDVERDSLSADTDFVEDLKADSLDVVELIMALEDEFEIEVPDDKLESVKTIGDVVGFLEEIVD